MGQALASLCHDPAECFAVWSASRRVTRATLQAKTDFVRTNCRVLRSVLVGKDVHVMPAQYATHPAAWNAAKGPLKESLPPTNAVISVDEHVSAQCAIRKLLEAQIQSMPVRKCGSSARPHAEWVGLISIRDLIEWAVCAYRNDVKESNSASLGATVAEPAILQPMADLDGISAGYMARRHPLHFTESSATLLEVSVLLAGGHMEGLQVPLRTHHHHHAVGHRRVALRQDGELVGVLSQLHAVRCIVRSWQAVPELCAAARSLMIGDLGIAPLPPGALCACSAADTAVDALEQMLAKGVSGLPILDEHGHLVGQLTAELLGEALQTAPIRQLGQPLHQALPARSIGGAAGAALAVGAGTSIYELFRRFEQQCVHRLFLVDDAKVVVGVVALKDAIALALGRGLHLEAPLHGISWET